MVEFQSELRELMATVTLSITLSRAPLLQRLRMQFFLQKLVRSNYVGSGVCKVRSFGPATRCSPRVYGLIYFASCGHLPTDITDSHKLLGMESDECNLATACYAWVSFPLQEVKIR